MNNVINIYIDVQKQNNYGWCIMLVYNDKQKIFKGAFKNLSEQIIWFKVTNMALKSLKNTSGKRIRVFLDKGYDIINKPKFKNKDSIELEKLKENLDIMFYRFSKTSKNYNIARQMSLDASKMLDGCKLTEISNIDMDKKIATKIANSLSYILNCDEEILTLVRNKNEKLYGELVEKLIRIGRK